jgi:signal transduction histidine kinase
MVKGMVTIASISEIGEKRKRAQFAALLRRGAESLRLVAEKKGNALSVEVPDGLPDVYIKSDNYTRVIANLLSNAIDHTRNGKISITAETDNSYIIVRVTDTGEGIPPGILQNVFDRGISGKSSTGYGLYLCKAVVEAHGGTISIESEPGKGTTVTFTIPIYSGQEAGHEI